MLDAPKAGIPVSDLSAREEQQRIAAFARDFSIEVTPRTLAKVSDLRASLRPGTAVYVAFIAGSDFGEVIAAASRLRKEGFEPVPHVAARAMPNLQAAETALQRLRDEADVRQILLVAGGLSTPAGDVTDTLQILNSGMIDRAGISRVGVAGHPEGSPDIPDTEIAAALTAKNEIAARGDTELYIVTQFCFEAAPIISWDRRIRELGNRLPIHIGIPGPASLKTLLKYAKSCGIGASSRFLFKQAASISKLLTVSAPDKLVRDLADYAALDPDCGIVKMHMFPLGGLEASARWARAAETGAIALKPGGGFSVE